MLLLSGHRGPVRSIDYSPDGSMLVSASYDGTVRVWDARTGRQSKEVRFRDVRFDSAAFSPDGRFVACGGSDACVRLWDWQSGEVHVIGRHDGPVTAVAFPVDSRAVVSTNRLSVHTWFDDDDDEGNTWIDDDVMMRGTRGSTI